MIENKEKIEEHHPPVEYTVHESALARLMLINKRLFWLVVVLIFLLFASNGVWLWYESQFEDTVVTQDVSTGEAAAYVTGIGDVYGTSTADGKTPNA